MESELLNNFKKALATFNLSEEDFSKVSRYVKVKNIKKKESFSKKNKVCTEIGVLFSGLLIAHYETEKSTLNVSRFFYTPDNVIVTSFESFKRQIPSSEEIVAIEDSYLATISFDALERLYEEIPALNKLGRLLAEDSYIKALQRIHELQVLDNKERVIKFYLSNKALYNRIQIQHIASYTGVHRNEPTEIIAEYNKNEKEYFFAGNPAPKEKER
jgi:signal-transduction protein with cAMP-binding, CBS, and nucleotidyltransferase domain